MSPRGDIWELFEPKVDSDGHLIKYLEDKSHYAAWCRGCLDRFVSIRIAADQLNASGGNLPQTQVKTPEQWRDFG